MDSHGMWCSATLYAFILLAVVDTQQVTPMECGVTGHSKPLVVNGLPSKRGFPWHVSVFKKRGSSYEHICGGSLIRPDLVVSAAHCFYNEYDEQVNDETNFMIAAGKYYRAYNHINDTHVVQKSAVSKIDIPPNYIGLSGNYAKDIALVRLEKPFRINTLVNPVCMDWNNVNESVQLQDGRMGKVMGWGYTAAGEPSEELQEINLPFVSYEKCSAVVPFDFKPMISTDDKFCAGYLNGSSVCSGDSGGGLCFESEGHWYLRGIVSTIPTGSTDLQCDNHMYATFTHVGYNRHWIWAAYDGLGELNGCILPDYPAHGSYRVSCPKPGCNSNPGQRVPLETGIRYSCNVEYALEGVGDTNCLNNEWLKPPICVKIPTCPTLRAENIICEYKGHVTSCANLPIRHGTKATCGTFYKSLDHHREITCLDDSSWDRPAPRCVPECGKTVDEETPLILHGSRVAHDDFPWFAHITKNFPLISVKSVQIGLGSLISPDLVVVGALIHFYWPAVKSVKEHVSVTVGEYHTLDDNARYDGQVSTVKDIMILPSNHRIALIRVTTPFVMTALVRPVCIDWDNRLTAEQLWDGNIGRMPYVPWADSNRYHTTDVAYYSNDCGWLWWGKTHDFCALVTDEKISVNWYIYGSGVCFKSDGSWYLRGIMTSKELVVLLQPVRKIGYFDIRKELGWFHDAYIASAF